MNDDVGGDSGKKPPKSFHSVFLLVFSSLDLSVFLLVFSSLDLSFFEMYLQIANLSSYDAGGDSAKIFVFLLGLPSSSF